MGGGVHLSFRPHPEDLGEGREEAKAMGDENDHGLLEEGTKTGKNMVFGGVVHGGEGIIQNEEGPAVVQGPGQGDAGLLASGEADTSFSDGRMDAFREGSNVETVECLV